MARSLRASAEGLQQAESALELKGWTQEYLAGGAGCSRQTVINFFARRAIDKRFFQAICTELGLEWGDVAELEAGEQSPYPKRELDELVKMVRAKTYDNIQHRCGRMRVLDMEQPISIDSIYTKVNILEKISRNQRRTIDELLEGCDLDGEEGFDRFTLGRVRQERIPGLEAVQRHDKLLILGKPGAGKTTFLKWLAIQCNEGQLYVDRVPIFITLKEFAETSKQLSLQSFISSQFKSCRIDNAEDVAETLLQEGRTLVLLDGLDEVRNVDHDRILQEICDVSTRFDASQFVITCRIAAREYTFQQFTEVEVADFDDEQIVEFSHKWFSERDPVKAKEFPKELRSHAPLKELATNPLLLTLLCLVFEERARFPANRAELYKEGLDVLLKKWDAKRNIRRDEVYKDLSLKRKEDLLSQIAFTTFEASEYFFKQKTVEQKIEQYIRNLPNASTDPEALQIDSEAVLKSIEAQHGLLVERARGIYSFSHLTFHEYFTARELETRDDSYQVLMSYLTGERWREVILLTVGMLKNANSLLKRMKSQIDGMLATDEKLQQFLIWVQQKSASINASYKPAAIRAFYIDLDRDRDRIHDLDRDLDRDLNLDLIRVLTRDCARDIVLDRILARAHTRVLDIGRDLDIVLDLDLARARLRARKRDHIFVLDRARDLDSARDRARTRARTRDLDSARDRARDRARTRDITIARDLDSDLDLAIAIARDLDIDSALQKPLEQLKEQIPNPDKDWDKFMQWCQTDSSDWIEQMRGVMIAHRNMGYDWQFSDVQKQQLQQYYNANKLLVDCLNSDCYVSREVRAEIEVNLLLPVDSIDFVPPGHDSP